MIQLQSLQQKRIFPPQPSLFSVKVNLPGQSNNMLLHIKPAVGSHPGLLSPQKHLGLPHHHGGRHRSYKTEGRILERLCSMGMNYSINVSPTIKVQINNLNATSDVHYCYIPKHGSAWIAYSYLLMIGMKILPTMAVLFMNIHKDKSSSHITVFWIMVQYCFVKDSSAITDIWLWILWEHRFSSKSEKAMGIKFRASGDFTVIKKFEVFVLASLINFSFFVQASSFWVK